MDQKGAQKKQIVKRISILSTRPITNFLAEQAANTGVDIHQLEFIRTEPLLTSAKAALLREIPIQATLVFTSTNAVEALYQLTREYHIEMPAWSRAFCMEGRTRTSVSALFPTLTIAATAHSALDLAEEILRFKIPKVYFICGNLRRNELPELLKEKNIVVNELELYRTYDTPVKVDQDFDGLVFFSPSAVSSFFSMNQIPAITTCFAIGDTTARTIREFTSNAILVSDKPRQDNIISMIIKHYQS
jgi:uroporphyrinogen-III synthase